MPRAQASGLLHSRVMLLSFLTEPERMPSCFPALTELTPRIPRQPKPSRHTVCARTRSAASRLPGGAEADAGAISARARLCGALVFQLRVPNRFGECALCSAEAGAMQGKFYSHQAVDRDMVHCPPPQRLSGPVAAELPESHGPGRTLASRTQVRVCAPPTRVDAGPTATTSRVRKAGVEHQRAEVEARYNDSVSAYARSKALSLRCLEEVSGLKTLASTPPPAPTPLPPAAAPEESKSSKTEELEAAYARSKALAQRQMAATAQGADAAERPPPPPPPPPPQVQHAVSERDGALEVEVGPLAGCSRASELSLDATRDALLLRGACLAEPLTIALPTPCDPTQPITAKFSKKTATLKVSLRKIADENGRPS